MGDTFQVRVKTISHEAEGVLAFDLRPLPPLRELPAFAPGAHIDLHLSNGLIRSYSLLNASDERHRYVIAVNKDPASRGGSRYLHETTRAGDTITVSGPRNNFPLAETAPHSVFIAGGIGITPLWSMIQRLHRLGRSWELHYAARARKNAALLDQLHALEGDQAARRIHFSFDAESGRRLLDMACIVRDAPEEAHLYCCGPVSMLGAFEAAAAQRAPHTVHLEYFAAKDKPDTTGGFTVELARTGRSLFVQPGKTILATMQDAGIDFPFACEEGVCGTCEVAVLSGTPDHRDLVLSKAERASNKTMMVCCSGAKSDKLVIDA